MILNLRYFASAIATAGCLWGMPAPAGWVASDGGEDPKALALARQVYFVNHFSALDNVRFGDRRHPVVLVDSSGERGLRVTTMVRHLNNHMHRKGIAARDLVIFTSGKLRGTGILVTEPADPGRPLSFSIWLPALRKIRRHSQPDQGDSWGGSLFTYGDIYLRKPEDEHHELLPPRSFPGCLEPMKIPAAAHNRFLRELPQRRCDLKGKRMTRLKSTTRFANWWYDYRIVWIDPVSHADYRSVYYKDGKAIKVIDKDWRGMGLKDPRAQYWRFWSGRQLVDGRQGMAFVPEERVFWNEKVKPRLWSEATLRRIKR